MNALQRYAAAAYRDGLDLPTIKDLASLASWGRHEGNVERDLHRMIPSLYGTEIPTHSTYIEFYNPDTARVEEREIQVLLASDILHALWMKDSPRLWEIIIGCTPEKTKAFWSAYATNNASMVNHPVIQSTSSIEAFSFLS